MSTTISRRAVLGVGASLSVGATIGLSGCAEQQDAGEQQRANQAVTIPTYTKFDKVTPDLVGDDILLDGFLKYPDEPVQFSDEPPGDGKPISFMTSIPGAIPPQLDKNPFWQEMNQRLGSPLEISMSSNDEYGDKFATRIAGGELPDVLNIPTTTPKLPDLLAAKCLDLTEQLSGDAVAEYPALANLGPDLWKGCIFDGKIWGIPVPRAMARTSGPLYRADLLAEKGITDPKPADFSEFLELCKELTDTRHNRWCWDTVPLPYLMCMLEVANNWAEEGGTFTRSVEQEGYQQGLEAGRKMVEAGVCNPDGFSTGGVARKQWIAGGSALMTRDSLVAWNQFYTDNMSIDGFEMRMMDTPGYDGGEGSIFMGAALNNLTAFNANSDHDVTTLLKVADYLAAPFGTEEYRFKKYGEQGRHYELQDTDPLLNKTGTVETGIGLQYLTDPPMALYLPQHDEVVKAQYEMEKAFKPRLVFDASYGLYSDTQSSKGSQIDGSLWDLETQILLGKQPVSAWGDAIATWRKGGGDKVRSEYEQAFAAANE